MSKYDLRERTYNFGLSIILLVNKFPQGISAGILGKQLLRSGTSVGANCEEADGASTKKDFIYKMYISKREACETRYWLRLVLDAKMLNNASNKVQANIILKECEELIKILSSIINKSKSVRDAEGIQGSDLGH